MPTDAPHGSNRRTIAGFLVATVVAPVSTVICLELILMLSPSAVPLRFLDELGGAVVFILIATTFGSLLAAIPVLIIGSVTVAIAHGIGTTSRTYYASAGLLGGLVIDGVSVTVRSDSFVFAEAMPFLVGGCLSALAYRAMAER